MYSLMLMTAMASAPETPEFHGFFRRLFSLGDSGSCCGGSGRSAGAATSCTGSGCGGYDNGKMRAFTRDDPSGSCSGRTSAGSCTGSRSAAAASGCCGGSMYIPRGATPDPYGSPPMPGSSGPLGR